MKILASFAFVLVTFWGTLLDKTTNQPLEGVRVNAAGPVSAHGLTDASGKFALANLRPGNYTITVQSKDVPAQSFTFKVTRSVRQTIEACSTTLDYQCGDRGSTSG